MSRLLCAKNTNMGNYALLCNLILLVQVSMQGRLKIYYRLLFLSHPKRGKLVQNFYLFTKLFYFGNLVQPAETGSDWDRIMSWKIRLSYISSLFKETSLVDWQT